MMKKLYLLCEFLNAWISSTEEKSNPWLKGISFPLLVSGDGAADASAAVQATSCFLQLAL